MRADKLKIQEKYSTFDNSNKVLSYCFMDNSKEIFCEISTSLELGAEDKALGICFPVQRKNTKENDIYRIKESGKTVGWVIPIVALQSSQHDYAEDKNFLKGARYCLKEAAVQYYKVSQKESDLDIIDLSDVLPNDLSIIVVYPTLIKDAYSLSPLLYSLSNSLMIYGFYTAIDKFLSNINHESDIKPDKNIKLSLLNNEDNALLVELLNSDLFFCGNSISRFLTLYQAIEYFIEIIYDIELSKNINSKLSGHLTLNQRKGVSEEIGKLDSERKRVSYLESSYTNDKSKLSELKASCNYFLRVIGEEGGSGLDKTLYDVRNIIIHNFHNHRSLLNTHLEDINLKFVRVVCYYISSFYKSWEI